MLSADPAGALGYYTAVRDALIGRPPSRMLADCLRGRSGTLANLGRVAEAVDDGRRALTLSRELGYPAGVAMALAELGMAALFAGDQAGAVRLAQQAEQAAAGIPGWMARLCSIILTDALLAAGDLTMPMMSWICSTRLALGTRGVRARRGRLDLSAITAPSLVVSGAKDLPDFRLIAARLTAMLPGRWNCPGPGTCPRWNDRRNCPRC